MVSTQAWILRGEWVACCPRDGCTNAEFLDPGRHPRTRCTREAFFCSNCQMIASVEWPPNPEQLMEPLSKRPVPQTRNWLPAGHPEATRSVQPVEHGQTVDDLWAENRAHGVM